MFRKEQEGLKNNTVRKVDKKDERFKLLKQHSNGKMMHLYIFIINSETGEIFKRWIKDVTFWGNLCIITWATT